MKTAVLFKTYSWTPAVEQAFFLCKSRVGAADLFIVYDTTGRVPELPDHIVNEQRVFLTPLSALEELGFEHQMAEFGGHWYNGDYQQNLFAICHPEYEYVCVVEADVGVYNDLGDILLDMINEGIDIVYHPISMPNHNWTWIDGCRGYYDTDAYIEKGLFCVAFYSRRALDAIVQERLAMSRLRRESKLTGWPIGEVVQANTIKKHRLRARSLIEYCDHLDYYDWTPAFLFEEIDEKTIGRTFVHSVSDLDAKFFHKNFLVEYGSLISERSVKSGLTRERLCRIRNFEVLCRAFHSGHVQWHESRWQPILDDALLWLPDQEKQILHGPNALTHQQVLIGGNPDQELTWHVVRALPHFVRDYGLWVLPLAPIWIMLPDRCGGTVIVSSFADIEHSCCLRLEDGREIWLELRGRVAELYFYGADVPDGFGRFDVVTTEEEGVQLQFLSLVRETF